MLIEIREERPDDATAIREVNKRAFGQDQEGNIVDALRANGAISLSLVATVNGRIVGHVMYSPITVGGVITGAALGPMAVVPEYQRQGIGTALVDRQRKASERRLPIHHRPRASKLLPQIWVQAGEHVWHRVRVGCTG